MNRNLMVIALEMSIILYLRIGVPYLQLAFFLQHTSLQLNPCKLWPTYF
jgi:hypothetical protein